MRGQPPQQQRLDHTQHMVDTAEEPEPRRFLLRRLRRWAEVRRRFKEKLVDTHNTWSTPRKNQNHDAFCCGAFGFGPRFAGESRKSSSIRTPFALRATGRFAISTRSGKITVRLQYEILSRRKGRRL